MTTSTVHWQIHALAQQQLTHAERQIISKFIHEWLPLQDYYHVQSNLVNNQCPSCQQCMETVECFLQCPHPDQQAKWQDLHNSIYKIHTQQQVPPQCYTVVAYGLYEG